MLDSPVTSAEISHKIKKKNLITMYVQSNTPIHPFKTGCDDQTTAQRQIIKEQVGVRQYRFRSLRSR